MSSSRNWSHNSFEDTMKKFIPHIKLWWLEHMNIVPVNYSEWSDTIYVIVELKPSEEGMSLIRSWDFKDQAEITSAISTYLRRYFEGYLNTNIGIQEFRTITHEHNI
jgi:hypothetical protein